MSGCAPDFFRDGWCRFGFDPALADWVRHALPAARATLKDSACSGWWRYQRTWFAGVNALPNGPDGAVAGGPALDCQATRFVRDVLALSDFSWDRAQVSACFPGYPKPMTDESEAVFNFRLKRDAAHVDGLVRDESRRRSIGEFHGFILGIPLVECSRDASPLVVWRGSHEKVRSALRDVLDGVPEDRWPDIDVTEAYQAVRRDIFQVCERVPVVAAPGEAYLVHRLSLHGVAPWASGATAGPDGRMIAYFRPPTGTARDWLEAA